MFLCVQSPPTFVFARRACVRVLPEFLPNAAGEDVVAGIRTPQPLEEMAQKWPDVYGELFKYQGQLEKYYGDMQVRKTAVQNTSKLRSSQRMG